MHRFHLHNLNCVAFFSYRDLKNQSVSSDDLWITNENLFVSPLMPILKDIRHFVKLTKEAVVVHFNNFPIGMQR